MRKTSEVLREERASPREVQVWSLARARSDDTSTQTGWFSNLQDCGSQFSMCIPNKAHRTLFSFGRVAVLRLGQPGRTVPCQNAEGFGCRPNVLSRRRANFRSFLRFVLLRKSKVSSEMGKIVKRVHKLFKYNYTT